LVGWGKVLSQPNDGYQRFSDPNSIEKEGVVREMSPLVLDAKLSLDFWAHPITLRHFRFLK